MKMTRKTLNGRTIGQLGDPQRLLQVGAGPAGMLAASWSSSGNNRVAATIAQRLHEFKQLRVRCGHPRA
jgi:anti-sigma factor RsiW